MASSPEDDRTQDAPVELSLGDQATIGHEAGNAGQNATTLNRAEAAPDLPAGYVLIEELGRGGMGVVYKALQVDLNRLVAIKMILGGKYTDSVAQVRFLMEAEVIARVVHANVVQVFEFGRHEGQPYFVLEYVSGGSLAGKRAQVGSYQPKEAAALVAQLADAIAFAHAQGVIHRDLKPANVLLTGDGSPKLTDFGLAKIESSELTASGAVMGTPSYMAPEQASGQTKTVGPAADIYALGAILYELLTGTPPFQGDTILSTLQQVISQDPISLRSRVQGIPKDLETICLKCLQKQPSKRYATAADLATDLRLFLEGRVINARPASQMERLLRYVRRRPIESLAVLLVFGSILASAIYSRIQYSKTVQSYNIVTGQNTVLEALTDSMRIQSEQLQQTNRQIQEANQRLDAQRASTEETLYATSINLAHREWISGIPLRARQVLKETLPNKRGWEYSYLLSQLDPERHILKSSTPFVYSVLSQNGRWIATTTQNRAITIWDTELGLEHRTIPQQADLLAFGPDGRLAWSHGRSLHIWDETFTTELFRIQGLHPYVSLQWSQDGSELLVLNAGGQYQKINSKTGQQGALSAWKIPLDAATRELLAIGIAPVISPDGNFVAQGGEDCTVNVWDLKTGQLLLSEKGHINLVGQLDFSPDSRRIASVGGGGDLMIYDIASKQKLKHFRPDPKWLWTCQYSPDGKHLLCGSKGCVAKLIDTETGETIQTFRGHSGEVHGVRFFKDGRGIFTTSLDGTGRIWPSEPKAVAAPSVQRFALKLGLQPFFHPRESDADVYFGHVAQPMRLALSPNGQYAATVSLGDLANPQQLVVVWDLVQRKEYRRFSAKSGHHITLAFSPTSDSLAICTGGLGNFSKDLPAEVQSFHLANGELLWRATTAELCQQCSLVYRPGLPEAYLALHSTKNANVVIAWDAATGKELRRIPIGKPFLTPQFLSQNQLALGMVNEKLIHIVDIQSDQRREIPTQGRLTAFSAASGLVAAAHDDSSSGVITTWNSSGQQLAQFKGHTGAVLSLCFSPDGSRLLSGGTDFSTRIWNPRTGSQYLTFSDHHDIVRQTDWSGDKRRIASLSADGALRVWSVPKLPGNPQRPAPRLYYFGGYTKRSPKSSEWTPESGDWQVQDLQLIGTLKKNGVQNINSCRSQLTKVTLPQEFAMTTSVTISAPMRVCFHLSDPTANRRWTLFISNGENPFQLRGAGLELKIGTNPGRRTGPLKPGEILPGRTSRIQIQRMGNQLTMHVDGVLVLEERIPTVDLPQLAFEGTSGQEHEKVTFSDFTLTSDPQALVYNP